MKLSVCRRQPAIQISALLFQCAFLMLALATSGGSAQAAAEAKPDFGPNVLLFDPSMPSSSIQDQIDKVYAVQRQSEFGPGRNAFLFMPGKYSVDVPVGFYTEVLGLGASPDDVRISGNVHADASRSHNNATCTFWRAAEGFSVTPTGAPCSGLFRRRLPSAACTSSAAWCFTRTEAGQAEGGCRIRSLTATLTQVPNSNGSHATASGAAGPEPTGTWSLSALRTRLPANGPLRPIPRSRKPPSSARSRFLRSTARQVERPSSLARLELRRHHLARRVNAGK